MLEQRLIVKHYDLENMFALEPNDGVGLADGYGVLNPRNRDPFYEDNKFQYPLN